MLVFCGGKYLIQAISMCIVIVTPYIRDAFNLSIVNLSVLQYSAVPWEVNDDGGIK